MRITNFHKLMFLAFGLASLGYLLFTPKIALAANPTTINFQGKVVNADGSNVTNGSYSFVFRIYNTASPTMTTPCTSTATCVWQETRTLAVNNGVFQLELGDVANGGCALTSSACNNTAGGPINFSSSSSLYLTLQYAGDTSGANGGFMSPTIHMTSTPFALQADNSSTLSGLAATNFVQLAQGLQTDSSTTNASIAINKTNSSGSPNILTLQKSNVPVLTVDNGGLVAIQPAATLTGSGTQTLISQTLTTNQTGGTVNAISQAITVSNASGATTTNGLKIAFTANASTFANNNVGIQIDISDSGSVGTTQKNYAIIANNSAGTGIKGSITGSSATTTCSITFAAGVCGVASLANGDTNAAAGVFGVSSSSSSTVGAITGGGVIGYDNDSGANGGGTGRVFSGIKGITSQSTSSAYTSIGVYGEAKGGSSSTAYGGYFTFNSTQASTNGAALYASNSSIAANIMDLQDNTTSVFTIGDSGLVTASTNSATGFVVKDSSSTKQVFTIDTSGDQVMLGKAGASGLNGKLVFNNGTNTNTIAILTGVTSASGGSGYSLTLPLTGAAGTQCLQSTSGSSVAATTLIFNSCGAGAGTLASTYSSGATTGDNVMALTSGAGKGAVLIQDASGGLGGNLFAVQKFAGAIDYLGVTAAGVNIQSNATGVAVSALSVDTSTTTPHLKVFGSNGSDYADVYFTGTTAVYGASAGKTAVLGSGTGPVSITSGTGSAFSVTGDANSTISTTTGSIAISPAGALTLQGGTTASLLSTSSSTVTVDSGTTGAVLIGATNNTNAKNVSIGNNNGSTTLDLDGGNGGTGIEIGNTTTNHGIQIGTNASSVNTIIIGTTNSTSALTLQGGTNDITITSADGVFIAPTANSTNTLTVKNASGLSTFSIDTTAFNATNFVANPSFETAVSNWSALNGGSAGVQSSAQAYEGTKSLIIATNTTAGGGGSSYSTGSTFLSTATTYTLSAYVKTDSNLLVSTFEMGRMDNGSTTTNCLTAQTLPKNAGWQRFSCTFTTGTVSGNPAVYFKVTDAVNRNLYIDDVQVQTDSNSDTNYRNAAINFTGAVVNGSVILQNATNSTNALQVENASGNTIFNVDTTDTNLVSNPGFEVNATGWALNAGSTIVRSSQQSYLGAYSLKVTGSTTANNGAQFALNPVVTSTATTYTISWFAKLDAASTAMTDMAALFSADGTTTVACTPADQVVVTTGWKRFSCSVASGATTPSTGGFVRILQTGVTAGHIYYIDGVQLEAAASASAYGAGAITLNGVISSPVTFKSAAATTAFQIQNTSNLAMLSADSVNNLIQIGSASTDANAILLVLDSYNNATDPTAVNGAMYYNSNTGNMRCAIAGAWETCNGLLSADTTSRVANTCTVACAPIAIATSAWPANYCVAGRTFHLYVSGIFGTNAVAPTLNLGVYLGTSSTKSSDTLVGVVSDSTTMTASLTARGWHTDIYITCVSTTTVMIHGSATFSTSATTGASLNTELYESVVTGTVTTSASNIYLFPAFGTSNVANTITGVQTMVTGQ